ncbi:site-specific DNA-methyltransferase [Kamptonema sp. UHCC 0994]|uniref:site-specific DNA-methyltransferase n=1 Tax=Kamptonema sp. UHCC 0994 TaxID=3031329 RepID=UPI0023B9D9CF|nr:site-specific DNA-methyltransferase [Kamptonema sp. UHCC 0994]MDF0554447.1 site-specific DNA-methyltransferase [Kamptonema sp. UHCC 0994]
MPSLSQYSVPSTSEVYDSLEQLDRNDLIKLVKTLIGNGVALTFHGKRSAMEIAKKVRPRVMRREQKLHVGAPEEQSKNLLIEGENLQAMVTLYKYQGQVDLILSDPPYNTGQNFRYNDRWDRDPNDPDLGTIVTKEDGSRHTKWIKAMMPRLQMMKAMLKPGGVMAICIDENELFHLGMMMDEEFGESNRIAIINWQKTYSAKNDSSHVSTATEYVLVYAKSKDKAKTGLLERTEAMDARYSNSDNDPNGDWTDGDLSAKAHPKPEDYGIQSPFTGQIQYPSGSRRWSKKKSEIKKCLEEWGSEYVFLKDPKATLPSIVLKGTTLFNGQLTTPPSVLKEARERAIAIRDNQVWPQIIFRSDGEGGLRIKRYLKDVKKGRVPMTYWADEDYEEPLRLEVQSWEHEESGHSQSGINELDSIVGKGHGFDTVKPLKLFKKIIQLWCPNHGLVLDPYAGSGTTGQAVLELNKEAGSQRRFILIEQGSPDNGDKYARTLTWQRLKNAITGERPDKDGRVVNVVEPLGGGFEFRRLTSQIDAKVVLSMKRDELIDVVITSHWETERRNSPNLIRIDDPKYTYLVGKDDRGEGYFIIWNNGGPVGQLDTESYRIVLSDAKKAGLTPPYHVYARYEVYQSPNVQFWKIPDKILAHLGLNENSDRFNEDDSEEDY